jgi:hypothetical protein
MRPRTGRAPSRWSIDTSAASSSRASSPGEILKHKELEQVLGPARRPCAKDCACREEGLVAAPQRRARVLGLEPERVETLCPERISLDAVGVAITANAADRRTIGSPRSRGGHGRIIQRHRGLVRHTAHREVPLATVSGLGPTLVARVGAIIDKSRHYVHIHRPETIGTWAIPTDWHGDILAAVAAGDAGAAAAAIAGDLANAVTSSPDWRGPGTRADLADAVRRVRWLTMPEGTSVEQGAPEQASVADFSDIPSTHFIAPTLTTMHVTPLARAHIHGGTLIAVAMFSLGGNRPDLPGNDPRQHIEPEKIRTHAERQGARARMHPRHPPPSGVSTTAHKDRSFHGACSLLHQPTDASSLLLAVMPQCGDARHPHTVVRRWARAWRSIGCVRNTGW